jgi:membrane protein YqaA with SNARE-associated domain
MLYWHLLVNSFASTLFVPIVQDYVVVAMLHNIAEFNATYLLALVFLGTTCGVFVNYYFGTFLFKVLSGKMPAGRADAIHQFCFKWKYLIAGCIVLCSILPKYYLTVLSLIYGLLHIRFTVMYVALIVSSAISVMRLYYIFAI